jgi:hypothetical protein
VIDKIEEADPPRRGADLRDGAIEGGRVAGKTGEIDDRELRQDNTLVCLERANMGGEDAPPLASSAKSSNASPFKAIGVLKTDARLPVQARRPRHGPSRSFSD